MKVQHIPSADGLSGHYVPYGTKTTSGVSGATNCAYDAIACQTDKVGSGAQLREKVADRLATSTHTTALYHATERLRAHNPRALREGGDFHAATMYLMQKDPHDFHNKLLLSSNKDYRALEKQKQEADKRGDEAKIKELASQLREMEVKAFEARREQEARVAGYILQWGAGVGAFAAAAPAGPLAAYAAGTGAFAGVGIALDQEIHADIKAGDWSGALNHSSYHLPFVGAGRNSWDAWHAGNYLGAAGHAGLFGVEALGLRGIGKLQGAGKVWWGGKVVKLKTRQGGVGEKGAAGGREIVVRSLGDPNTLRGAKMSEVNKLIPEGWVKMSLKKGKGVRYVNPSNPGESILIEHGWKNTKDLLHSGPYVRIARDGKILRIPLSGNPVL